MNYLISLRFSFLIYKMKATLLISLGCCEAQNKYFMLGAYPWTRHCSFCLLLEEVGQDCTGAAAMLLCGKMIAQVFESDAFRRFLSVGGNRGKAITVPQFTLLHKRNLMEYLRIMPKHSLLTILNKKCHKEPPLLTTPKNA